MKKTTAIKTFKTASNLARALGLSRMAVSRWGEDIPELRVYQIERLVNAAKENSVELSQLRIGKDGRVIYKVPKGETPPCVQRSLKRLSLNSPAVGA